MRNYYSKILLRCKTQTACFNSNLRVRCFLLSFRPVRDEAACDGACQGTGEARAAPLSAVRTCAHRMQVHRRTGVGKRPVALQLLATVEAGPKYAFIRSQSHFSLSILSFPVVFALPFNSLS